MQMMIRTGGVGVRDRRHWSTSMSSLSMQVVICVASTIATLLALIIPTGHAFLHPSIGQLAYPRQQQQTTIPFLSQPPPTPPEFLLWTHRGKQHVLRQSSNSENDKEEDPEEETYVNPYADPNYPDLEFVDYSDPAYASDRSEYFADDIDDEDWKTELEIEKLREERRRQNDEYQYQVYYRDVLRNGATFYGEWQIYETSTFRKTTKQSSSLDNPPSSSPPPPQLIRRPVALAVQSSAHKRILDDKDTTIRSTVDDYWNEKEHIQHFEQIVLDPGIGEFLAQQQQTNSEDDDNPEQQQSSLPTYWPEELRARDFRGHQGIMVCGNAWTICTGIPLSQVNAKPNEKQPPDAITNDNNNEHHHLGPFAEYRAELGIQADQVRMRIKLDYAIQDKHPSTHHAQRPPPPLHLKTMTVCREALEQWPRLLDETMQSQFFGGPTGAAGGLYDPPPVPEALVSQYMLVDLEGGASVLIPHTLDQTDANDDDDDDDESIFWVTSLDWCPPPGRFRYQVDRKVHGGRNLLGLKTLELSEVQAQDADTYRPRDGGQNMRQ